MQMPDCGTCNISLSTGDGLPPSVFCGSSEPSVMVHTTFSVTVTISGSCDFCMTWRQVPIEDSCCDQVNLSSNLPSEMNGDYVRLSMPILGKAAYYREEEGDHGERGVLSYSSESWKLSSTKYMIPGNSLGPYKLGPDEAHCAEDLSSYTTFDPTSPDVDVAGSSVTFTCLTSMKSFYTYLELI